MDFSFSNTQAWHLPDLRAVALWASSFAPHMHGGQAFGFSGPLGAGKTTCLQHLAKALGLPETLNSPTYAYLHTYVLPSGLKLVHADLYRAQPVERIVPELLEYLSNTYTLLWVEWPECWPDGKDLWTGTFSLSGPPDYTVTFTPCGNKPAIIVKASSQS